MASLDVRVEPADALRLRRAIVLACGDGLQVIEVARVPASSRLRVSVGMHLEAYGAVMSAIVREVPDGEFRRLNPRLIPMR